MPIVVGDWHHLSPIEDLWFIYYGVDCISETRSSQHQVTNIEAQSGLGQVQCNFLKLQHIGMSYIFVDRSRAPTFRSPVQ